MAGAWVGLGSNLEQPREQVQRALRELAELKQTRLLAASPLYATEAIGPAGQPDYINAVAQLDTALTAYQLLSELQAIEQAHERVRSVRWGPRTLDLDLLLFDGLISDDPTLTVPHPRMHERSFVLAPLADIAPDIVIPGRGHVAELLARCPPLQIQRLPATHHPS